MHDFITACGSDCSYLQAVLEHILEEGLMILCWLLRLVVSDIV